MGFDKCLLCSGEMIPKNADIFDTRFGIDYSYGVAGCPSCHSEQTIPLPLPEELVTLYQNHYNFGGEKGTRYTRFRHQFLTSMFYRFWMAMDGDISFHGIKGSGRLLDIGCNEGRGLGIYQKNGFYAEGLEVNQAAADVARAQGFTVYAEPLEKFQPKAFYDVAVLSNVLEHSLNPKDLLHHVRRILTPTGQIWISCPNNRSWIRTFFGRYWINWHMPFHVIHFSEEALRSALETSGFKAIQIGQETPALWVAHSVIARLFAQRGKPTRQLRSPLLVAFLILGIRFSLFPWLWLGNRLGRGDCLVAVGRNEPI